MGRKFTVSYVLYRCHVLSPHRLRINTNGKNGTGFSEDDLALLWDAIMNMFEHDHSAARGQMAAWQLIVFKYDSNMGNAPRHKLFDMIKVELKQEGEVIRDFGQYKMTVPTQADMPQGVEKL